MSVFAQKKLTPASMVLYLLAGVLLTVFLQGAVRFVGPIGVLLNFLTPLPSVLLQMLAGLSSGLITVVASAFILSSVADPSTGIAYVLQFGVLSLVLPFLLRRGYAWDRAVVGTLAVILLCIALFAGALASSQGVSVQQMVSDYVASEIDSAIKLSSAADVSSEQMTEIQTSMVAFLLKTWPGLLTVFTGGLVLLTVFFLSLFSGLRERIGGTPFHHWKSPEFLIWALILSGFSVLMSDGVVSGIGLNILTILLSVYFLQGMAIITFYFRKKGVTLLVRAFGYSIAIFLNPLPLVVTGLGVFDLWADFRKPRMKEQ